MAQASFGVERKQRDTLGLQLERERRAGNLSDLLRSFREGRLESHLVDREQERRQTTAPMAGTRVHHAKYNTMPGRINAPSSNGGYAGRTTSAYSAKPDATSGLGARRGTFAPSSSSSSSSGSGSGARLQIRTPKMAMLQWVQRRVARYPVPEPTNFTTSWQDGSVLTALVDSIRPGICPLSGMQTGNNLHNIKRAMNIAEAKLSVPAVMDAEDMALRPEERSCMTYVSAFCHLPEAKAGGGSSASSPRAAASSQSGAGFTQREPTRFNFSSSKPKPKLKAVSPKTTNAASSSSSGTHSRSSPGSVPRNMTSPSFSSYGSNSRSPRSTPSTTLKRGSSQSLRVAAGGSSTRSPDPPPTRALPSPTGSPTSSSNPPTRALPSLKESRGSFGNPPAKALPSPKGSASSFGRPPTKALPSPKGRDGLVFHSAPPTLKVRPSTPKAAVVAVFPERSATRDPVPSPVAAAAASQTSQRTHRRQPSRSAPTSPRARDNRTQSDVNSLIGKWNQGPAELPSGFRPENIGVPPYRSPPGAARSVSATSNTRPPAFSLHSVTPSEPKTKTVAATPSSSRNTTTPQRFGALKGGATTVQVGSATAATKSSTPLFLRSSSAHSSSSAGGGSEKKAPFDRSTPLFMRNGVVANKAADSSSSRTVVSPGPSRSLPKFPPQSNASTPPRKPLPSFGGSSRSIGAVATRSAPTSLARPRGSVFVPHDGGSPRAMKFCPQCAFRLESIVKFCPGCRFGF